MSKAQIYADFDSIVFEGREKGYGAFQMRKDYDRFLARATLITFLLFLSLTGLPKVLDWVMPNLETTESMIEGHEVFIPPLQEELKEEDKEPEEKITAPALPPPPPAAQVQFLIAKPTPDDQVDAKASIAALDDIDSAAIGLKNIDGDPNGGIAYNFDELIGKFPDGDPIFDDGPKDTLPDSKAFVALDAEPRPVNLKELKELIGYPKLAIEAEIEGKVTLRVLIDKRGDYVKHIVLKDPHPILTSAVTNKIHQLKMTPGIQAQKPIPVWVTVPFEFELLNNK